MRALSDHFGGAARRRIIPPDLIIFHNEAAIPTGWTRFTDPDGRRLIGAGTTYSNGEQGGANSHSLSSETSDSLGAHTHSYAPGVYASGASAYCTNDWNCGNHTHDFTLSLSPEPDFQQLVMIKSQSWLSVFPAKGLLLWDDPGSSPSGLTQQYTGSDDKLVRAGASITSGGTTSGACSTTSAGSHTHDQNCTCTLDGSTSGSDKGYQVAGSHTHSTVDYTFNMKRRLLGLWTDASADFKLAENMIAMYELATPPGGWTLCNGTGGTVDMRDFMLAIANQANQGNNAGDNTSQCKSSAYSWSHNHHTGNDNYGGSNLFGESGTEGAHQHTFDLTSGDYFPTYHGIYFIQYTG